MATVDTPERLVSLPPIIETRLQDVRRRESRLRLVKGLIETLSLLLSVMLVAMLADWAFTIFSTTARTTLTLVTLGIGLFSLLLLALLPQFKRRSLVEVAGDVDRSVSSLEERWQTVTEISASSGSGAMTGSPAMLEQVFTEAVARENLVESSDIVTTDELKKHQWILGAVVAAHLLIYLIDAQQAWVLMQRFWSPMAPISLTQVTATSGDIDTPRGEPLRLEATLGRRARSSATLFLRDSAGVVTNLGLKPTDADGTQFAHAIDAVDNSFAYRFRAGDGQTGWHQVSVYDRPKLTGVEFRLSPPEYTKLPVVEKLELPRKIRAVEGSRLEIGFSVDQPLNECRIKIGQEESVALSADVEDAQRFVFSTTLAKSITLSPILVSKHNLQNERSPTCRVIVYPDRAPQVRVVTPENDVAVRPDDEIVIDVAAQDDFGIARAELIVFTGDEPDLENAIVLPMDLAEPADGENGQAESASTDDTPNDKATPDAKSPDADQHDNKPSADTKTDPSAPDAPTEKSEAGQDNGAPNKEQPADATANEPADGESDVATAKPTDRKTGSAANDPALPEAASTANEPTIPKAGTVVKPISLADQTGEKNVRVKVKLDLKKFDLKQGEQLRYMVRVYDSQDASSEGQPTPDAASADQLADASAGDQSSPSDNENQQASTGDPAAPQAESSTSPDNNASQSQSNQSRGSASASDSNSDRENQNQDSPQSPGSENQAQPNSASASKPSQNASEDPSSEASSSSSQSAAKPSENPPPESQGKMTGAPRPEDSMTRRRLDVDSQSASSSKMTLRIDEWAGSFKGQQRHKLEILIDPVLKQLDEALAKSLDHLAPVSAALKASEELDDELKNSLGASETHVEHAEALVGDLVKTTAGTAYAFIGLQLVDITELHIAPAHTELNAVRSGPAEKQLTHTDQATFHINRARQALADLTRKYETVKQDNNLAENMQRIERMYQIFIEDSMALLSSSKPNLNPKDRKMAELELDEEFLEQYTELQKRWQRILAELAKALADDPRLLERYMNASRRSADSLRDQLTLLNLRQKELLTDVERLDGKIVAAPEKAEEEAETTKEPVGARIARRSLQRDLLEIAGGTATVREDFKTWLPLEHDADDETIARLHEQSTQVATTAAFVATAPEKTADEQNARSKKVDELIEQMDEFDAGLTELADGDDAQLAEHANRRLVQIGKLQMFISAWKEKNAHLVDGEFHRVLEVDQHQLAEGTLELSGKLDNLEAQLAGLPDDILDLADEMNETLKYDALVDQMSAELALQEEDLPSGQELQQSSLEHLARAEELFDKLIDRIIEEQDKVPPEVPDLDNTQLPTLEELLAQLENEQELAEALGIPPRITNLQQLRDWLMRNSSGRGMGSMASGARMQALLAAQARKEAQRAVKKAQADEQSDQPMKNERRWNTLGSRLEDVLRQGRGNMPPKQYRRAIERYFELISGAERTSAPVAPDNADETK